MKPWQLNPIRICNGRMEENGKGEEEADVCSGGTSRGKRIDTNLFL